LNPVRYDFTYWNTTWNAWRQSTNGRYWGADHRIAGRPEWRDLLGNVGAGIGSHYSEEGDWWTKSTRGAEYTPALDKGNPTVGEFLAKNGWPRLGKDKAAMVRANYDLKKETKKGTETEKKTEKKTDNAPLTEEGRGEVTAEIKVKAVEAGELEGGRPLCDGRKAQAIFGVLPNTALCGVVAVARSHVDVVVWGFGVGGMLLMSLLPGILAAFGAVGGGAARGGGGRTPASTKEKND
jgi:hypothetical protein